MQVRVLLAAPFASVAQLVEQRAENPCVAGPTPAGSTDVIYSSIAQLVEHAAVNRRVVGSSPTGGASCLPYIWH